MGRLGMKNVAVLGHYAYRETKEKLEMHKHSDMLEICFLETGSQYYKVGDQDVLLKGGDVLITPPDVLHGTSGYPEEKGSLYWILLHVPRSEFRLLNLTKAESKNLVHRLLQLPEYHFRGSSEMKKTLASIYSVYRKEGEPLRKITIANQLLSFLLMVVRCGVKNAPGQVSDDMHSCCQFIEANIMQQIRIENLAKNVNLSESRFKHKFKSQIGTPPNEYILRAKLRKARILLESPDHSVSNIAYDLGFSSPSYFSTVFKKYVGKSPSGYRTSQVAQ